MSYKNKDDEIDTEVREIFEDGEDGDDRYGSAVGWDPERDRIRAFVAEHKRKNPRAFAPVPEMLYVREAQYYLENAAEISAVSQLFGPFWIFGEMAILFAQTGVGKSVLATQIAESLARGVRFAPFDKYIGPVAEPLRVLYLDFELTREQFRLRYTVVTGDGCGMEQSYQFSPDLLRAESYWDGRIVDGYEDYTDMLFEDLHRLIARHEAEVLIVDNITFLTRSSTANSIVAFRLMERLQTIKKTGVMSILVLAHTPKRRRDGPLTDNDLQGSVDLAKVCDSAFAMGRSRQSNDLRYIKHIKSRSCRREHGADNVAVFRFQKFDFAAVTQPGGEKAANFLGLEFEMFDGEENHELRASPASSSRRKPGRDRYLIRRAKSLAELGLSSAAVAKRLSIGKSTAHRYMKEA